MNTQKFEGQRLGKVVAILKGYPRLSETFIAQELLGLEQQGIDLHIVSLRHPTDPSVHAVHNEIKAPVLYLPEYLHHEPVRVVKALIKASFNRRFWATLGSFAVDLKSDFTVNRIRRLGQAVVLAAELPADSCGLYAHFLHTPASVAYYTSLITSLPWSVSAHAKDIWTTPQPEIRKKLDSCYWAVTCTRLGYEYLQGLSSQPDHVYLSYHGINLDRFPCIEKSGSLNDGASEAHSVLVLSVGRAVPKKGYDILLGALSKLPKNLYWRFVHIGAGSELDYLKQLGQDLGIDHRIEWIGATDQSNVLHYYQQADLFALACRVTEDGDRDGLPNVLVEASSQGLACITTRVSAIPEVYTDGVNAVIVEPENSSRFMEGLQKLMLDPALRDSLGQSAQQKIRSSFDYRVSVKEISQLLSQFVRVS